MHNKRELIIQHDTQESNPNICGRLGCCLISIYELVLIEYTTFVFASDNLKPLFRVASSTQFVSFESLGMKRNILKLFPWQSMCAFVVDVQSMSFASGNSYRQQQAMDGIALSTSSLDYVTDISPIKFISLFAFK